MRQGLSRAPYRCRPCSERTGQVVYRAGHKCPVEEASVPDVLPDQPWDLSAIFPMQETPSLSSSGGPDIFGFTELPFPTPTVSSGVDFGAHLSFIPFLRCLIPSQICTALVVRQLQMKLDSSLVRVIH